MAEIAEPPATASGKSPRRKLLFASLATVLGLIFLEGLLNAVWVVCSLVSLWSTGPRVAELKEEYHCEYDSELGWINRPGVQLADFYGPGKSITINDDGVRGLEDYTTDSAGSRFRTICLGDSFTLGYGVDDRQTFPFLLEQQAGATLQVVNMGQGGYSIGQCWLWLKRTAPKLQPDAVVCIFIVEDFRRLGTGRTANGFSTPQFDVVNERVKVRNTPVPAKLSQGTLVLKQGELADALRRNSSIARTIARAVSSEPPSADADTIVLGLYLIKEIQSICAEQECPLAFVLTPTLPELFHDESIFKYQNVSRTLANFLEEEDIPYLDLHDAFTAVRDQSGDLFLSEAFHHYSRTGNELVARELNQWLPSNVAGYPGPVGP